ncbi:MAG: hypothetical protein ATN35_07990 [Epulopiscium sp. Nele67-Bin004]|nr:MAG: hypothetical protein ATN35_07990 [Epulopiscium sp. Nele67-Bin004]
MYLNTFINLEENINGYSNGSNQVTGHATITMPGRVKLYVDNLKDAAGKDYVCYLMSKSKNKSVRLGELSNPSQSKQNNWKIDLKDVCGKGLDAASVDAVAIVVEGSSAGNTDVVLVGYTGDKYLITPLIEKALPKLKPQPTQPVQPQENTRNRPQSPTGQVVRPQLPTPEVAPEPYLPTPEVTPEPYLPTPEVTPEPYLPTPEVTPEPYLPTPEVAPEPYLPTPEVAPEPYLPTPEVAPEPYLPTPEVAPEPYLPTPEVSPRPPIRPQLPTPEVAPEPYLPTPEVAPEPYLPTPEVTPEPYLPTPELDVDIYLPTPELNVQPGRPPYPYHQGRPPYYQGVAPIAQTAQAAQLEAVNETVDPKILVDEILSEIDKVLGEDEVFEAIEKILKGKILGEPETKEVKDEDISTDIPVHATNLKHLLVTLIMRDKEPNNKNLIMKLLEELADLTGIDDVIEAFEDLFKDKLQDKKKGEDVGTRMQALVATGVQPNNFRIDGESQTEYVATILIQSIIRDVVKEAVDEAITEVLGNYIPTTPEIEAPPEVEDEGVALEPETFPTPEVEPEVEVVPEVEDDEAVLEPETFPTPEVEVVPEDDGVALEPETFPTPELDATPSIVDKVIDKLGNLLGTDDILGALKDLITPKPKPEVEEEVIPEVEDDSVALEPETFPTPELDAEVIEPEVEDDGVALEPETFPTPEVEPENPVSGVVQQVLEEINKLFGGDNIFDAIDKLLQDKLGNIIPEVSPEVEEVVVPEVEEEEAPFVPEGEPVPRPFPQEEPEVEEEVVPEVEEEEAPFVPEGEPVPRPFPQEEPQPETGDIIGTLLSEITKALEGTSIAQFLDNIFQNNIFGGNQQEDTYVEDDYLEEDYLDDEFEEFIEELEKEIVEELEEEGEFVPEGEPIPRPFPQTGTPVTLPSFGLNGTEDALNYDEPTTLPALSALEQLTTFIQYVTSNANSIDVIITEPDIETADRTDEVSEKPAKTEKVKKPSKPAEKPEKEVVEEIAETVEETVETTAKSGLKSLEEVIGGLVKASGESQKEKIEQYLKNLTQKLKDKNDKPQIEEEVIGDEVTTTEENATPDIETEVEAGVEDELEKKIKALKQAFVSTLANATKEKEQQEKSDLPVFSSADEQVGELTRLKDIFDNNLRIEPFGKGTFEISWVKVSLSELISIPQVSYDWATQSRISQSYHKYGHLILGKEKGSNRYFVGIPDNVSRLQRNNINIDKVIEFVPRAGRKSRTGESGYWVAPL